MNNQVIVMCPRCPYCGQAGEAVMSAADAEYGETLRWAGVSMREAYPNLSKADQELMGYGLHADCLDTPAKVG